MDPMTLCQVLLVEDEPGDAHLVRQLLNLADSIRFQVTWLTTLGEACQHLSRHLTHVVLLDLSLPDSTGINTIAAARQIANTLPIIVLTGHNDTDFALQALAAGAQDYLIKGSFETDGLVRAIRYAISRASLEKRLYDSEQRMALALSGAELGLWDWHIPTGQVVFSELWAKMLGYTLDEISPHISTWERLVHPEDWILISEALEPHLQGKTPLYQSEHRMQHKNGQWVWVHDIGRVLERDAQGQPIRAVGIHQDISQRKAAELRDHLLVTALEAVDYGIIITDVGAKIEWINRAFTALTGYSREEIIGLYPQDLVKSGVQDQAFYNTLWQTILSGSTWQGDLVNRHKNGTLYDEELTITPVKDHRGVIRHFVGVKRDITERKRIEAELWEMATTDVMTGFFNRRHFMVRLEEELARLKRHNHYPVSLLMLDLDRFKRVNDRYGHAAGDAVIKYFAGIVLEELRRTDIVGRLGGEEFAILLVETPLESAQIFAERLRQRIANAPLVVNTHIIAISVSIGITEIYSDDTNIDAGLIRADQALYAAKSAGRNRVEIQKITPADFI